MNDALILGIKFKPQRKKRKRPFLFILFLFIAVSTTYGIFNRSAKKELISPLSYAQAGSFLQSNAKVKYNSPLAKVVGEILNEAKGTYGITIKNLKIGESFSQNEHRVFESGSLYKLWVMATAYKQIENSSLTEDQTLEGDIASLNNKFNIDPSVAELKKGTMTMTVNQALNQMITISHNYAALMLSEKVKLSNVANFLKENGFKESVVGVNGEMPKSTAADITLFYEKLYKGELANQEFTDKMINLLKQQQLNNGLPKYLPDKQVVAHKTGDLGWFKHDAGIVFTAKGDYIITMMSESDSPPEAQERIALISKAVYEYFTK